MRQQIQLPVESSALVQHTFLQRSPGTYALILSSTTDYPLQVGRLGQLHLRPGFYVYVGSALGPGGLLARVAHHRRRTVRPHWHIDYVRAVAPLTAVWYAYDTLRWEHQWAEVLQCTPGATIPLQRFGASDCTCMSHLFFFTTRPSCYTFCGRVQDACGVHTPIYCQRLEA